MVAWRTQLQGGFLFFYFYFLYQVLWFIKRVQRPWAALAMAKENPCIHLLPAMRKSHHPESLWYGTNHTPATQNKKSNSDYLTGAKKKNQVNRWGGSNRKTQAVFPPNNKRNLPVHGAPSTSNRNQRKNTKAILGGNLKIEQKEIRWRGELLRVQGIDIDHWGSAIRRPSVTGDATVAAADGGSQVSRGSLPA